MASLVETLTNLDGLPCPSSALKTLLAVAGHGADDEPGDGPGAGSEVGRMVARDQTLTLLVLRTANAGLAAGEEPVTGLRDAIARLGPRGLWRIVTADLGAQLMGGSGTRRCALGGAVAAEQIARNHGLNAELAFTAGLLRDCGSLALEHLAGAESEQLDHAAVGAALATTWGLPEPIVRCIEQHHAPKPGIDDLLVDAIHVADRVCAQLGLDEGGGDPNVTSDAGALARLEMDRTELQDLVRHTAAQLERLERIL